MPLFEYLLKQLFTLVSVASGRYLPRLFKARQIPTSHLHFGDQLLYIILPYKINISNYV